MLTKPDRWVLIELIKGDVKLKKVLASWYGGYAGSDSWKLSSGVINTIDHGDHYAFHNSSGSIYICYKTDYGMSGYTSTIYSAWQTKLEETNGQDSVCIIEETKIEAS